MFVLLLCNSHRLGERAGDTNLTINLTLLCMAPGRQVMASHSICRGTTFGAASAYTRASTTLVRTVSDTQRYVKKGQVVPYRKKEEEKE